MRPFQEPSSVRFEPLKALWLTLPSAALASLMVGPSILGAIARRLSFTPVRMPSSLLLGLMLVLLLFALVVAALVTSYRGHCYCRRTIGYDRLRRFLSIFNGLAFVGFGLSIVLLPTIVAIAVSPD